MLIASLTFHLVSSKIAKERITVGMDYPTWPIRLIILPKSFVLTSVGPDLIALSIPVTVLPLADVHRLVLQLHWALLRLILALLSINSFLFIIERAEPILSGFGLRCQKLRYDNYLVRIRTPPKSVSLKGQFLLSPILYEMRHRIALIKHNFEIPPDLVAS